MDYRSVNPATGEQIETYRTATEAEVERALDRSAAAFPAWREVPAGRRGDLLLAAADLLERQKTELAELMALEMGKTVAEGEAEAEKCAWGCRYYAENGPAFLGVSPRESDGSEAFIRHEPLGPILAIMPWNFPFWQFFRFAAPSLMAGNVVLLKHAPNTPGCALKIERLLRDAGTPDGVVQNLFLTNDQAARVIGDGRIRGVTLTGSTRAGREVASTAGRHLKTSVMELGGSDAFVVLEDADVDRAVATGVVARCLNNGQSCIASKRFLVHESAFDRFREGFVAAMESRVMGDPLNRAVSLGPLARRDLRYRLADQVTLSREAGARVLLGGEVPDREGYFYPATVLTDIEPESPAAREELFGPVAALMPFRTEDEALAIANGTGYGLGASLWTSDRARAERLIPRFETGSVFVNGLVKSDPRLPFGGVKDSGFGRELGREGILEFVNLKTVWIA